MSSIYWAFNEEMLDKALADWRPSGGAELITVKDFLYSQAAQRGTLIKGMTARDGGNAGSAGSGEQCKHPTPSKPETSTTEENV